MRARAAILAAALVAAAVLAMPARAAAGGAAQGSDDLARAQRAYAELDYDVAWLSLDRALRAGSHGPDELVLIYELSGRVAAAFGNREDAVELFEMMLALDPAHTLGRRVSSKLSIPFERARAALGERGALEIRFERVAGLPRLLKVAIASDPLSMVAGVEVDGEPTPLGEGSTIELPRGTSAPIHIAVVDRHGNRLAETVREPLPLDTSVALANASSPDGGGDGDGDDDPTAPQALDARADAGPSPSVPIYRRWYVWGGLAVVAATVSVYYGLEAQADRADLDRVVQNSGNYTFADAQAIERRGHQHQMISNVSLGGAIVCAAAAVILPHVAFEF